MIKCIVIHIKSPEMNANDNDDNCNKERRWNVEYYLPTQQWSWEVLTM